MLLVSIDPMRLKQQAAVEFMATYGWEFIIIGVFMAFVFVLVGIKSPVSYLASTCSIQPLLPCSQTLLTYNAIAPLQYYVLFMNNLGVGMNFSVNAFNATTTNIGSSGIASNYGNCTPTFASSGSQVVCIASISGNLKPAVGAQTSLIFSITYNICRTNSPGSCQPINYKSSGYSLQTIAPSNFNLVTLALNTNPTTGTVVLNGANYFNGVKSFFVTGNYILFAAPPACYKFSSWSVSTTGAPPSTLSTTTAPNTTLSLNSNTVVNAIYASTPC